MAEAPDWASFVDALPLDERERVHATRDAIVAGLTAACEENVIGQIPLQGVEFFKTRFEGAVKSHISALERELPFTWEHSFPMQTMVRTRPRLLWLHGRLRTRRWATRHRLLEEYLAINYGFRFDQPVTQVFNTVRVA